MNSLPGRKHLAQTLVLNLEDTHSLPADPLDGEDAAVAKEDDKVDLVGGVADTDVHKSDPKS